MQSGSDTLQNTRPNAEKKAENISAKTCIETSQNFITSFLKFLDPQSIAKYACVNTFWNATASDPVLWKPFTLQNQQKIDRICQNPYKFMVELSEANAKANHAKMKSDVINDYWAWTNNNDARSQFIVVTSTSDNYVTALHKKLFPMSRQMLNPEFVKATFESGLLLTYLEKGLINPADLKWLNMILELNEDTVDKNPCHVRFKGDNYIRAFQFLFCHEEFLQYVFQNINKYNGFNLTTLHLCIHFFALVHTKLELVTLSDIENLITNMNHRQYSTFGGGSNSRYGDIYGAKEFIPEHLKDAQPSLINRFLSSTGRGLS